MTEQVWMYCTTHDIKFMNRSVESQNHRRPTCAVTTKLLTTSRCRCDEEFADCLIHPILTDDERLMDQENAQVFPAEDDEWMADQADFEEHYGFKPFGRT